MAMTVVVCTDGSDLALAAASAGFALLQPADTIVVATVVHTVDPSLADDGGGHAGPSMSPAEVEAQHSEAHSRGETVLAEAAAALRAAGVAPSKIQQRVLTGKPGPALCELARDLGAHAIVVGSRGRGGIRRALLGSVSDYVVRHSPCSVVVTRDDS